MTRYDEAVAAEIARQKEAVASAGAGATQVDEELIRIKLAFLKEDEALQYEPALPSPKSLLDAVYQIGAQYYSVRLGRFLEGPPSDPDSVISLAPATLDNLKETLAFYGLPIGPDLMDLDQLRAARLAELTDAFDESCQIATVESSLGFVADANETANRNVAGLITLLEAGAQAGANAALEVGAGADGQAGGEAADSTVADSTGQDPEATIQFCAHDNSFHSLNLADLKILQLEILAKGPALYAAKWQMRNEIMNAKSKQELAALEITF